MLETLEQWLTWQFNANKITTLLKIGDSLPNFISTKVLKSLVHKQIIQILNY